MSRALDAAAPFILLLLPGILPLIFLAHQRLISASISSSTSLTFSLCIFLLGPLATLSAVFGVVALDHANPQFFHVVQNVVNCLVEVGYRTSIVHLITPNSIVIESSHISLPARDLRRHNVIVLLFVFTAFLLSILQLSLSIIPRSVPSALGLAAALLPIPLLVHLTLSTSSYRVRRIWSFAVVLQILSALTSILRIPSSAEYTLACAVCSMLWGNGILVLFYSLLIAPLSPSAAALRPHGDSKFALLDPAITRARVHYHTRSLSPNPGIVTSEDFTALRDPFASPPPVSPISPIYPAFPRPQLSMTAPMRQEVRGDAPSPNDDALLNQVLLHSLTADACADSPCPETVRDIQEAVRMAPDSIEMQAVNVLCTIPGWWTSA